jgi:hypothetical protein
MVRWFDWSKNQKGTAELLLIYLYFPAVGNVTSKCNCVTRSRSCHVLRAITFVSDNGSNFDRAITLQRNNGSYVSGAITFRNNNFPILW